jgi:hypothetical protein
MAGSGDKYRSHLGTQGGSAEEGERDCAQVRFVTTLQQSPNAPVHHVGDLFELLRIPSGELFVVGVVSDDGFVVGTVIEEIPELLRCTAAGFAFVAEVLEVSQGIHRVLVRPAEIVNALRYSCQLPILLSSGPSQLTMVTSSNIPEAEVSLDSASLNRTQICEIRSLLRVGVVFYGATDLEGFLAVSQP